MVSVSSMFFLRVVKYLFLGCVLVACAAGASAYVSGGPSPRLAAVFSFGGGEPGQTYQHWTRRTAFRSLPKGERLNLLFRVSGKAMRADVYGAKSFGTNTLFRKGEIAELRRREIHRDLLNLEAQFGDDIETSSHDFDKDVSAVKLMTPPKLEWEGAWGQMRNQLHRREASIPLPSRVQR